MVTENINIIVTTRGARVASRGIDRIGRSSRTASIAVRALGVALSAVAAAFTVRSIARFSDSVTEIGNRIRTVTNTSAQFLSVQDRLFDVATSTGGAIEDTARLYQRLAVATRDIGVGSERVINVVQGLNAALIVSGSTAREASAALLQLGQGLASDNLSGEELRSLRENLPQLAQGLASELGVGIGALKELGRQGKLNAETVFPALERAIVKFQTQLKNGDVVFTFAQAFNAVVNEVKKFIAIVQNTTGVTKDLNKAIFDFADGLAERLVLALANAIESAAGFFSFMARGFTRLEGFWTTSINAIRAVGVALGVLADIAVLLVEIISVPFQTLINGALRAKQALQQIGGVFGLVSAESIAESNAAIESSTDGLKFTIDDIINRAEGIGEAFANPVADGIDDATRALTPLELKAKAIADSLRNALDVPLANVLDDPPKDFFERAADNTKRITTERGEDPVDVPVDLAQGVRDAFGEGFAEAIKNGGDVFDLISTKLEDAANNALIKGMQTAFDTAQGLLEEAFKSAATALGPALEGIMGDIGPALGDALSGAVQFVALQALSALLGGGGNDQRSSSSNVQSAVTSTQAVRGIVAGPTEVAIANVGRNIAEAIDPLLQETVVQTGILRGILTSVQSGTAAAGGGTSTTTALAFGSPPAASV